MSFLDRNQSGNVQSPEKTGFKLNNLFNRNNDDVSLKSASGGLILQNQNIRGKRLGQSINFEDSKNSAMKIEDPYGTQTKNVQILPSLQNSIMNRFRNKSTANGNSTGSFDFRIRSST